MSYNHAQPACSVTAGRHTDSLERSTLVYSTREHLSFRAKIADKQYWQGISQIGTSQ